MTAVSALQACLAAEHAAVYGYGVLGGVAAADRQAIPDQTLATAGYAAHRARRDALTQLLVTMDVEPAVAEPAYSTPFPVRDVDDCQRLGRHIEHRAAAVYSNAVAETADGTRRVVARALADAAVREVRWGGQPQAFPGAADL